MANGNIPNDFIDFIRSENPYLSDYYGDSQKGLEQIYTFGKNRGYEDHYEGESSWSEVDNKRAEQGMSYGKSFNERRQSRFDQSTSPTFMNSLASMADYGIDESSWAGWRMAYNNSLTGKIEELWTGKSRYDNSKIESEYEQGIVNDVMVGLVSLVMPMDILAFAAGGKWVGQPAAGMALKGMQRRAIANVGKFDITLPQTAILSGLNMAGTLSAFEGAHHGVQAAIDGEDAFGIAKGVGYGVLHGGALGMAAGMTGGALSAVNARTSSGMAKAVTGLPAQVAAEAGIFTAPEALKQISEGDIRANELLTAYATNVGMFGIMKGGQKLWGGTKESLKAYKEDIFKDLEKESKYLDYAEENVINEATRGQGDMPDSARKVTEQVRKENSEARKERNEKLESEDIDLKKLDYQVEDLQKDIRETAEKIEAGDTTAEADFISRRGAEYVRHLYKVYEINKRLAEKYGTNDKQQRKAAEYEAKAKAIEELLDSFNSSIELAKSKATGGKDWKKRLKVQWDFHNEQGRFNKEQKRIDVPKIEGSDKTDWVAMEEGVKQINLEIRERGGASKINEISKDISEMKDQSRDKGAKESFENSVIKEVIDGREVEVKVSLDTPIGIKGRHRRKGESKDTNVDVSEIIKDSNISENNKKRVYQGVSEFGKETSIKASDVKNIIDLVSHFESQRGNRGKSISEMTKADVKQWLKDKKIWEEKGETNKFNQAMHSLARFFGGRHPKAAAQILSGRGYAGKYSKIKDITTIEWGEVIPGKATRITSEQNKQINKTIDNFVNENINVKEQSKGMGITGVKSGWTIAKQAAKDIVNFFYHMPKRSKEVLSNLKVKDWNPDTGMLTIKHVEKGGAKKISIPIDKSNPLYEILQRNSSGKDKNSSMFGEMMGGSLKERRSNLNGLYKYIMKTSGIEPIQLLGREGKTDYTSHNNRHSAMTDAIAIHRESNGKFDFRDLVDQILLGHGRAKDSRWHYATDPVKMGDVGKELVQFQKQRELLKEVTDADSNLANERLNRNNKDVSIDESNIGAEQSRNISGGSDYIPSEALKEKPSGDGWIYAGKNEVLPSGVTTHTSFNYEGSWYKFPNKIDAIKHSVKKMVKQILLKDKDLFKKEKSYLEGKSVEEAFKEYDKMSENELIETYHKMFENGYKEAVKTLEKGGIDALREAVKFGEIHELIREGKIDKSFKLALDNIESSINKLNVDYQVVNKEAIADYKKLGRAEKDEQIRWVKKTFPHLYIKLRKTLGTKNGDTIIGKLTGHLIEISKGKARPDTIPHEVAHHAINVLRATGGPKAKQLIERAIKGFGGEEAFVQRLGEYMQGRLKNKSMTSKIKAWLKDFWIQVKELFGAYKFKDDKLIRDDITVMLGERILRGDINVSSPKYTKTLEISYQKVGPEKRTWNSKVHKLEKKVRLTNERKSQLRKQAGWLPNKEGKWIEADVTVEQLQKYHDLLSHDNGKGSALKHDISDVNIKYDVNAEFQDFWYKQLGIKDIDAATPHQIRRYTSMVIGNHEAPLKGVITSWEQRKGLQSKEIPNLAGTKRAIMSVYDVLKTYGGEPGRYIANAIAGVERVQYTRYKGVGDKASKQIKALIGKSGANSMWVIDKARSKPLYEQGLLTKKEKNFYEQMDIVGTKEHKAVEINSKLMNYFWEGIFREISPWATKNQLKNLRNVMKKQYVTDYFTRRVTADFIKHASYDSYIMNKLVDSKLNLAAEVKAISEGHPRGSGKFKEKVAKYLKSEDFRTEVKNEIFDSLNNSKMEMKNSFLEERGLLLKEYYVDPGTGKKIRTYETSFDNTVEAYVNGMSKYLGVLRYLPEYTGIGTTLGFGVTRAKRLDMLRIGDKDMGWYAQAVIERELGLETTARDKLKQDSFRKLGAVVNMNAMIGLSSPLSGIKNILIQLPRSVAVYGARNTLAGVAHAFKPSSWDSARMKGQLEYGSKALTREAGEGSGVMKWLTTGVFKWNLMGITENANRVAIAHAGKLYAEGVVGQLRGERRMFRAMMSKKQIRKFLDQTLEMSESDIRFLETTKRKSPESEARWQELMIHAEHYSHVKSAGGTSTGLLPLWATSPGGKALTLFQRMAYVTTVDAYKNYVKPAVAGNVMPLVKATIGHGLSGYALYQMYDYFFSTEPPKSHDGDFDIAMQYLWRGEFLGLFGSMISPYGGVLTEGRYKTLSPVDEPIVLRNVKNAGTNFYSWYSGGKDGDQAIKDWITQSVVVAGQLDRYTKVYKSKHYEMLKRIDTAGNSFKQLKNIGSDGFATSTSERQPYYRNLKEALFFKSEGELTKEIWKTYNFLMHEAIDISASQKASVYRVHKQVISDLLSSVSSTSPLHDFTSRDLENNNVSSYREEFIDYLKKGGKGFHKDALELHKLVEYKKRKIQSMLQSRKYRYEYSNYPTLSQTYLK